MPHTLEVASRPTSGSVQRQVPLRDSKQPSKLSGSRLALIDTEDAVVVGRRRAVGQQRREVGVDVEARRRDDPAEMNLMAGEVVGLIHDLPAARTLLERVVKEAEGLLPQLAAKASGRAAPKVDR